MKKPRRKFIYAGNLQEATAFAKSKAWDKRQWKYIRHAEDLQGFSDGELLLAGTWYEKKDRNRTLSVAKTRGFECRNVYDTPLAQPDRA